MAEAPPPPADAQPQNQRWFTVGLLHGAMMTGAFRFYLPLGVYFKRTATPPDRAFRLHWTTQAVGSLLALSGFAMGLSLSKDIRSLHQLFGLVVAAGLVTQLVASVVMQFGGGRRGGDESWPKLRATHAWLGWGIILAAWVNVVVGLLWTGWSWWIILGVMLVMLAELGLAILQASPSGQRFFGRWTWGRGFMARTGMNYELVEMDQRREEEEEEAFALVGAGDEEDDDDDESER